MEHWPRIVLHADMDAFYAAVEQLDHPEYRGRPILVGPRSHRGVVLTASYEARPFGVGSAMPVAEARRRCPQAIMVPPRFARYEALSRQVMAILGDFSPAVEALSLDEAFVDMTGAGNLFGSPADMASAVKLAVKSATGLDISVGVAGTKYVAKVASAHDKPDGLTIVPPDNAVAWLAPQPVDRLWGVGPRTAPRLLALGLDTIGAVATADPEWLRERLGAAGEHFHALANARDPRPVEGARRARSLGSDRTLSADVTRREDIEMHLRRSAERVARRLRAKGLTAGGVRVRLKTRDFRLLSRQRTLVRPTDSAAVLLECATELIDAFASQGPWRLVGLAAFDLRSSSACNQLDLFEDGRQARLEATIDELIERFGDDIVVRARDLGHRGTVTADGVNLDFLDTALDR